MERYLYHLIFKMFLIHTPRKYIALPRHINPILSDVAMATINKILSPEEIFGCAISEEGALLYQLIDKAVEILKKECGSIL